MTFYLVFGVILVIFVAIIFTAVGWILLNKEPKEEILAIAARLGGCLFLLFSGFVSHVTKDAFASMFGVKSWGWLIIFILLLVVVMISGSWVASLFKKKV